MTPCFSNRCHYIIALLLVPVLQPEPTLRAKYPQDFTVTPAQARGRRLETCCATAVKREEQICQYLKEGNFDAAQFHCNWLIAEMVLNAGTEKKR